MRGIYRLPFALCLAMSSPMAGAVTINASQDLAAVPANAGTGLAGSFYSFEPGTNIGSLAVASSLISAASGPTATFTTTTVCFPDCAGRSFSDTSSPTNLLNGHVSNFSYPVPASEIPTSVSGSAMALTGFIAVNQAGTYNFNLGSDDGSQLTIGGQTVISNDFDHGFQNDTGAATFSDAGLYAISIMFFEDTGSTGLDLWASDASSGSCIIGRAANCVAGTVATGLFYLTLPTMVPEPASRAIFAAGLCALAVFRRHNLKSFGTRVATCPGYRPDRQVDSHNATRRPRLEC